MAESTTTRLLTGVQPSGALHIGNYFGALKPFAELANETDQVILMVADYHALTTLKDPALLRQNIIDTVKAYLAIGIDPEKVILFKQSDVPAHMELAWIFETLVTVPFLMQAHAYKDKVAKGLEANAGLFNYPMLMAADILLYDTTLVPVGQDQRQHIEYSREAASKFNLAYGQTFIEPEGKILEEVAVVPGIDGQKMSKSYKNTIPLFGTEEEITKAVMSIVTDSSGDRPEVVYAIHKVIAGDSIDAFYETNKGSYKVLKEKLAEDLNTWIRPMREKRDAITDAMVEEVLRKGGEKARALAEAKMVEVRKKIGVTI